MEPIDELLSSISSDLNRSYRINLICGSAIFSQDFENLNGWCSQEPTHFVSSPRAPIIMDFDRSTQARSWIFDENTLSLCREKILSDRSKARKSGGGSRVRKFAAGFHRAARRHDEDRDSRISASNSPILGVRSKKRDFFEPLWSQSTLTTTEQDVLVRFHAHQITMLTGPQAVLPELRRSQTVLATAIMFFRRFYLSNSVLDFSPRRMAVAAAFLAAKVEENRVEVRFWSHRICFRLCVFQDSVFCRYSCDILGLSIEHPAKTFYIVLAHVYDICLSVLAKLFLEGGQTKFQPITH